MFHFYLFYLFLSFSIGLLSLGIVVFLYAKTRERVLQHYLYFCVPFSLLCASSIGSSYLNINLPAIVPQFLELLLEIPVIITLFTTSGFMHMLLNVSYRRLRNAIVAGLGAAIFTQHFLHIYVFQDPGFVRISSLISSAIFGVVILYTPIFGLYAARNEPDANCRTLARTFAWPMLVFLPGLMLDMLYDEWLDIVPPLFFPLCYVTLSIMLTQRFWKLYGHHHPASLTQPAPVATPETVSFETLCAQYVLSAREQEVLRLILDGYSNQKIGETLFISLSTVKTHIGNIFQKCSVKSRYELMALFQSIRQNPPSSQMTWTRSR